MAITWKKLAFEGDVITKSIINAKGDLIVGSADDTPSILSVGSNDSILVADSNESLGVKWRDFSQSFFQQASMYRSGSQSLANDSYTKILLSSIEFDPYNICDTSNNRIRPTKAGYYLVNGVAATNLGGNAIGGTFTCFIYKNGSQSGHGTEVQTNNIGWVWSRVEKLLYLNGSSDYVELYAYQYSGAARDLLWGALFVVGPFSQSLFTGPAPSAWRVVSEADLTNASSYTFSGLDGNADRAYKILIDGYVVGSGSVNYYPYITPNSATGDTYYNTEHYSTETGQGVDNPSRSGFVIGYTRAENSNLPYKAEITIPARTGTRRVAHSLMWQGSESGTVRLTTQTVGVWANSSSNISSLVINFDGTTFTGKITLLKLTVNESGTDGYWTLAGSVLSPNQSNWAVDLRNTIKTAQAELSSDISTSSTTWVSTGVSITISVGPSGIALVSVSSVITANTTADAYMRINRDSGLAYKNLGSVTFPSGNWRFFLGGTILFADLPVGNHTFLIEWRTNNTAYCRPATYPEVEQMRIVGMSW